MTALLEARNIARRHPGEPRWLLQQVSVELHAGGRLAVQGPSGSGKTLLLRSLAMLDPVDEGDVFWQGRTLRPAEIPSFRSSAIYLHQRAALLGEVVGVALRRPFTLAVHRHRQFDRRRIVDLLDQLGRDESFLEQRVSDLSGGEIQIAALLRAIQLDPAVLLLDEPTAALDPHTATTVEQLFGRWLAERPDERAMIWVTHDVAQAQRVAETTLRMEGGRIVDSG